MAGLKAKYLVWWTLLCAADILQLSLAYCSSFPRNSGALAATCQRQLTKCQARNQGRKSLELELLVLLPIKKQLECQVDKLKMKLGDCQESKSVMSQQVVCAINKKQNLKAEKRRLTKKLATLEERLQNAEICFGDLQISELKSQNLETKIKNLDSSLSFCGKQVDELNKILDHCDSFKNTTTFNYTLQIIKLNEQIFDLNSEFQECQHNTSQQTKLVQTLSSSLTNCTSSLSQTSIQNFELNQHNNILNDTLFLCQKYNGELITEISDLRNQLGSNLTDNDGLKEDLKSQKMLIEKCIEEKQLLKSENTDLNLSLDYSNGNVTKYVEKLVHSEDVVKSMDLEINQMINKLDQLGSQLDSIRRECNAKVQEVADKLVRLDTGGIYYVHTADKRSWHAAHDTCRRVGMELLETTEEQEHLHVMALLAATFTRLSMVPPVWIGVNDLGTEGQFVFSGTGTPVVGVYQNWPPAWKSRGTRSNCVTLVRTGNTLKWSDEQCAMKLNFVCKLTHTCSKMLTIPIAKLNTQSLVQLIKLNK